MNLLLSRYMMLSFVILMTVSCGIGKARETAGAENNSVNETLELISEATGKTVEQLRQELDVNQLEQIINATEKSAELTEATQLRTSSIAIFNKAGQLTGLDSEVAKRIVKSAKLAISTAKQAELIAVLIDVEKLNSEKDEGKITQLKAELTKAIKASKSAQDEATNALSDTTLASAKKNENKNRAHRRSAEEARNEALKAVGQTVKELSPFKEKN